MIETRNNAIFKLQKPKIYKANDDDDDLFVKATSEPKWQ